MIKHYFTYYTINKLKKQHGYSKIIKRQKATVQDGSLLSHQSTDAIKKERYSVKTVITPASAANPLLFCILLLGFMHLTVIISRWS